MNPPPSPITEAAGLLRSGALLARRVGLRPAGAGPAAPADILAGFKPGGFSLYFGDEPIDHFDLDGRWQRSFRDGLHHLKGLDGQVRVVDRAREGEQMVLRRRTLGPGEVEALDARIADDAARVGGEIAAGRLVLMPPPAPARAIEAAELVDLLDRIAGWGPAAWAAHRAAYRAAYGDGTPPFLPPDCPNPVVLRADAGMTAAEMLAHGRAVAALLGRRVEQCRDVFLAGPGWLDRPDGGDLLGAIRAAFSTRDAPRLALIHGWLDAAPARPPEAATWERCRAAGLGRVSIGVDPGAGFDGLARLVPGLKAAGIGVGLVLGVAGGADPAVLGGIVALPLGPGDLITLVAAEPSPAPGRLAAPAPAPADLAACKARLASLLPRPGPRVVAYNPDKQWT